MLNKGNLDEVVTEWEVASTPVKVLWHSKINQVRYHYRSHDNIRLIDVIDCDWALER